MGRRARDRRDMVTPRPVQKIELSEKHLFLRVIAVILLVTMGLGTIGYALYSLLHVESGLATIEANNGSLADVAEEFLFQYDLGAGELSATAEQKALTLLYGEAARKAYMIFSEREEFEGVGNLAYLNHHCNEAVQVEEELYRALEIALRGPDRLLYLAPVYAMYSSIFYSNEDWEAEMADPMKNEEARAFLEELMAYVGNPDMIELRLLPDHSAELFVAEEYQSFLKENGAEENGEEIYLDFGWTKNAFVIDYLSEQLIRAGFTHGNLSSFDGYMRNLDENGRGFEYPRFRREGNTITNAESFSYDGAMTIVYLRDFPLTGAEQGNFYIYEDGEVRTPYIDPASGLSRSGTGTFLGYSRGNQKGCSEVLMELLREYLSGDNAQDRIVEFSSL